MKIGNIDYTIREEYNLKLISDEYIDILKEINKGKSFEDIAKKYGQFHTNIRAKAKNAIEILQGKKPSKMICQNCGKLLDGEEVGKRYCNECNNGKIYVSGHENEQHWELTVDRVYIHKSRMYAECTCSCGVKCDVRYSYLKNGNTKSCGHISQKSGIDLTGEVNEHGIKALYDTGKIKRECHIWHCLCTCGKEFDVLSKDFPYAKSCGHLYEKSREKGMKNAHKKLAEYSVDGTNAISITSKIPKNNKSGYKGIYQRTSNKKWYAVITFKGKTYNLGGYRKIEDAIKERKTAEKYTHDKFLDWFAKEFPDKWEKMNKNKLTDK